MRIQLKDFQDRAVDAVYSALVEARERARSGRLEAITLSAPTGSGKTVVATRVIELVLNGDETRSPDPEAVFLWITDQPELNVQTREKMISTSSYLDAAQLVEIGPDFDEEVFSGGRIYFLNTQKLAASSSYVSHSESRSNTLWETISRTASERPDQFFVIVDEAHRGARLSADAAEEATSLMQRFVLGGEGLPPVPIVLGISATLERFTRLLGAAVRARAGRTHQPIDIDPAEVIESGLLKKKVVLYNPVDTRGAEFPLLRDAVRVWQDMRERWLSYARMAEEDEVVRPILLIQVQDGTKTKVSKTDLAEVMAAVMNEDPTLTQDDFAHSFQEGRNITLGDDLMLRYVPPSSINGEPDIQVVLFKNSLNTGWDCPRAEVMMSFRPAKDSTYIAQLVGRMVRAPLAREVERDDVLNSVSLMLPNFDNTVLEKVINALTSDDGAAPTARVERAASRAVLSQGSGMERCFEALDQLPTYLVPKRPHGTQVQRLGALADALTQAGLRSGAGSDARDRLVTFLQQQYRNRSETPAYQSVVRNEGTIAVQPTVLSYGTTAATAGETRQVPISDEMVNELYEWARKRLALDLGQRYWKRAAATAGGPSHRLIKLQLFALSSDAQVMEELERQAATLVQEWLTEHKIEISRLPEAERSKFAEIKRQVPEPTQATLELAGRLTIDYSIPSGSVYFPRHVYQTATGHFPDKLNTWETAVIEEELQREDVVAWFRNPSGQPWGLCVPYEMGGKWKSCYPDFVVLRQVGDAIVADVLDPHLISLEDAAYKASGLAKFAERHQDMFGRFELIVVESAGREEQRVKRLDLMNEQIRNRVKGVSSTQHLRDLFDLA